MEPHVLAGHTARLVVSLHPHTQIINELNNELNKSALLLFLWCTCTSTVQLSDKLHTFNSWTVYCTLPII